jgi:hypothetical protein
MESHKSIILLLLNFVVTACWGVPVDLKNPPKTWALVFDELATPGALKCRFEEARTNPFHRLPKRFEGRMFWEPEIGLCLFYEDPSPLLVNVLPDGVLMGRPREALQPLPGNRQEEVMALFSKLFTWDVDWLAANFTAEGGIADTGEWELSLRPAGDDSGNSLTRIDLEGQNGLLERIHLDLRHNRTVEISLSGQTRTCRLSNSEISLAFPTHDE